jgi:hypothetical protein
MMVKDLVVRLLLVTTTIGEAWLSLNPYWTEEYIPAMLPWYDQLEKDLTSLEKNTNRQVLISCYRTGLRDENGVIATMYEIHGAALLSAIATRVDLHVPRGDSTEKNFDVRAEIKGTVVNADCKTREDNFPFNVPRSEDPKGITGHYGARATVDPHDAADLGLESKRPAGDVDYRPTPESTVVRQILSDTFSQLPEGGCNLILFGQIKGDRMHMERALFGAEVFVIDRNLETKKALFSWARSPTGAFGSGPEGEPFQWLSGILWFRIWKLGDCFGRGYKFYLNGNASVPIPPSVVIELEGIMDRWKTEDPTGATT